MMNFIRTLFYLFATWININQNIDKYTSNLTMITVFTEDKIQLYLDVQVFYRPNLAEKNTMVHPTLFPDRYRAIVNSTVLDTVKGKALQFGVMDYYGKKDDIESALKEAVGLRLTGVCCSISCATSQTGCRKGCKSRDQCSTYDKGIFTILNDFKLTEVRIPDDIRNKIEQRLRVTTASTV